MTNREISVYLWMMALVLRPYANKPADQLGELVALFLDGEWPRAGGAKREEDRQ